MEGKWRASGGQVEGKWRASGASGTDHLIAPPLVAMKHSLSLSLSLSLSMYICIHRYAYMLCIIT